MIPAIPESKTEAKTEAAYYFGRLDQSGHFIHQSGVRSSLDPSIFGIPWPIRMMDGGLLKLLCIPDEVTGRVHHLMSAGIGVSNRSQIWHAFIWWDRSGDSRPNSNSGFYVVGFDKEAKKEAFDFACRYWPEVIERKGQMQLQLVERAEKEVVP